MELAEGGGRFDRSLGGACESSGDVAREIDSAGYGACRGGPRKNSVIRLGWSLGEPGTAQSAGTGSGSRRTRGLGRVGEVLEKRRDAAPEKPEG